MTSDGALPWCSGIPLVFMEDGHALVALDDHGDLIAAEDTTQSGRLIDLKLSHAGIATGDARIDRAIASMLQACREYSDDNAAPMPAPASARLKDGRTLHVDVFLVPRQLASAIGGARFMLVLRELKGRAQSRKTRLREIFGLTVTEADLADLLVRGFSLRDISDRLRISIWTARSHLRAIFQKTRTHRQGELIAVINDLVH